MVKAKNGEERHGGVEGDAGEAVGQAARSSEVGCRGLIGALLEASDPADVVDAMLGVGWIDVFKEVGEHAKPVVDVGGVVEELIALDGGKCGDHFREDAPALLLVARARCLPVDDRREEGIAFVVDDAGHEEGDHIEFAVP